MMRLASILIALILFAAPSAGWSQSYPAPWGSGHLLGRLASANMNTTSDQAITIVAPKYIIRRITVTNTSTSLTVAAGGFYTGAGKTGTTIVSAAQVYTGLTGTTKFSDLVLTAGIGTDVLTAGTIYFALTTAQGSAAIADIYLVGDVLP